MSNEPPQTRPPGCSAEADRDRAASGATLSRPNVGGPVLGRANIAYELSERTKATAHGGIGVIAKLITQRRAGRRDRLARLSC